MQQARQTFMRRAVRGRRARQLSSALRGEKHPRRCSPPSALLHTGPQDWAFQAPHNYGPQLRRCGVFGSRGGGWLMVRFDLCSRRSTAAAAASAAERKEAQSSGRYQQTPSLCRKHTQHQKPTPR